MLWVVVRLVITIVVFNFIFFLIDNNSAIDFQIHDTYIVLPFDALFQTLIFPFYLYFLFYSFLLVINRTVNPLFTKFHFYFSLICTGILLINCFISSSHLFFPRRYYSTSEYEPIFNLLNSFLFPLIGYLVIQISVFFYLIFTTKKVE